jgi:hypothetical protein
LYGTTIGGGDPNCGEISSGCGTVFELKRACSYYGQELVCKQLTLQVAPNDKFLNSRIECNPAWGKCSGNIVFADGMETTVLTAIVKPPQSVDVQLSLDPGVGSVTNAMTDNKGMGTATYTAGTLSFGDTDTKVDTVNGIIGSQKFSSLTQLFNYRGFQFHKSQVTDTDFVAKAKMDARQIQSFFEKPQYDSFLARFYLIGDEGDGGFFDANDDGKLDMGDTAYKPGEEKECETFPCLGFQEGSTGQLAAVVFANAAEEYGINPEVLLTTEEKEGEAPITSKSFPSASGLDFAFGCDGEPTDFYSQIDCAADTLARWFNNDKKKDTYFFAIKGGPCYGKTQQDVCTWVSDLSNKQNVGFQVLTAATYAQYKYTPFIETQKLGGVYSFELNWRKFHF